MTNETKFQGVPLTSIDVSMDKVGGKTFLTLTNNTGEDGNNLLERVEIPEEGRSLQDILRSMLGVEYLAQFAKILALAKVLNSNSPKASGD